MQQAPIPAHVPPNLVHSIARYQTPSTEADPYLITSDVHERLPRVFFTTDWSPLYPKGAWVVTRYEDIRNVYQTDELYSTKDAANFHALVGETFPMIPLAIDPPEHGKYRILLNPWFSPKAIKELEAKITAITNDLIDQFADKGEADAAYDYGRIYPVLVFLDLMGFPRDKLEEFLTWEYAILHSFGDVEKVRFGIGSAIKYLRGFIEETKRNPANNLTSHIVHGQVEGRPLTEDEIIGMVTFLWLGGLDTVAATTSLMFRRLALEPHLQTQLRENPALIPSAIEEFMRVQPLVNSIRHVIKDHEIHGAQVKTDDKIICFNVAGNFDAAEFERPREVVLDRSPNRHFTLSGGPHRCLGSHLARRELGIALEQFLKRIPPFRYKPGADQKAYPGLIAAPRVPLVWD